jgi:hypothetical protein
MHHGNIVATTTPDRISQHEVGLLMTGAGVGGGAAEAHG